MSSESSKLTLSRYQLPGFGLPLNFVPHTEYSTYNNGSTTRHAATGDWGPLFANALDCDNSQMRLTPLREFTMMRLMNQITDKPGWETKIFNEDLVSKWKSEALSVSKMINEDGIEIDGIDITERMVQYCFEELRHKATLFQQTGFLTVYNGDVIKSDSVVPEHLKAALKAATAPLENVPVIHRDWHPGSNETVLDLVHPSLFPVIYGKTRILKDTVIGMDVCVQRCGEGEVLGVPPVEEAQLWQQYPSHAHHNSQYSDPYSRKFQWLPCEVEFVGDTGVKITSYINNLHPAAHKPLYGVIERIIAHAIPLWNQTLTPLKSPATELARIPFEGPVYDPDPEEMADDEKPPQEAGETDDDYYERLQLWQDTLLVLPEPEEFIAPNELQEREKVDLRKDYAERGLQIIVKLANIHLTPEKPEYQGGTWHVEGQLNEHICATALYYYDSLNITESRLAFRQQSDTMTDDINYSNDGHKAWLDDVFGCEQDGSGVQYIGDVLAKEGRLLTFPNVFQHRVLPFKLADPAKPGHRKILALFLVDPHIRIISSANVPCQQREWWAQELQQRNMFPAALPAEMVKEVVGNVEDFPIALEEAKRLRLELMEERKAYVQKQDGKFSELTFSLCEH